VCVRSLSLSSQFAACECAVAHGSARGSREHYPATHGVGNPFEARTLHNMCAESRCASRARCSKLRRAVQHVLFGGIAELHQPRRVCLVQDALMHHRTTRPRAAAHLAHLKACLPRDNRCDARLAIIIVDVALAIAHASARALSDRLSTRTRKPTHAERAHTHVHETRKSRTSHASISMHESRCENMRKEHAEGGARAQRNQGTQCCGMRGRHVGGAVPLDRASSCAPLVSTPASSRLVASGGKPRSPRPL